MVMSSRFEEIQRQQDKTTNADADADADAAVEVNDSMVEVNLNSGEINKVPESTPNNEINNFIVPTPKVPRPMIIYVMKSHKTTSDNASEDLSDAAKVRRQLEIVDGIAQLCQYLKSYDLPTIDGQIKPVPVMTQQVDDILEYQEIVNKLVKNLSLFLELPKVPEVSEDIEMGKSVSLHLVATTKKKFSVKCFTIWFIISIALFVFIYLMLYMIDWINKNVDSLSGI